MRFGSWAGHEAKSQLGHRAAGQNGLGPLALVAGADAVDLRRRPRPDALERGEFFLPAQRRDAGHAQEHIVIHRQLAPAAPFPCRHRLHAIVKAVDRHLQILVVQAGDQPCKHGRRILHRAAEDAGMQVAIRSRHMHLQRRQPAQAISESRDAGRNHR